MSKHRGFFKKIAAPLEKAANISTLGLTNFGGSANNPLRQALNGPSVGPAPVGPDYTADAAAIAAQQQSQQSLTNQALSDTQARYTQQQQQLQSLLDKYRQNTETSLTSGPEGEALRQKYNSLGLLNSGAFNDALSQKFGDIQRNADLSLMQQGLNTTDVLQGIAGQGYQTQSDLGLSGLQRQFGVEDEQYQAAMNSYLARMGAKNDRTNALIGAGGNLLGGFLGKR